MASPPPQTSLQAPPPVSNPAILASVPPTAVVLPPLSPLQSHHAVQIPPPAIPKSSNPALPFSVDSAPQSAQQPHPPLPLRPLTFAEIRCYYRRFSRFVFMELLKSFIGLGVGAFMTYLLLKNKK